MYINVDNGGTFTDFWAFDEARRFRAKTRTTPHDLSECLFEGLRLLAEDIYRRPDIGRLLAETRCIRYSTTQGTNALVQRKGPRIGLILASRGVHGAMRGEDGGETVDMIDTLVGDRIEILDPAPFVGAGADDEVLGDLVMTAVNRLTSDGANRIVVSLGSREAERTVRRLAARRFPQHLLGTVPILEASDVTGDADQARATWTAVFNAFLHPAMERFLYNTDNRLKAMNLSAPLLVFRNDGLAGRVAKTPAIKTYGSGPEGGVCGAEALAADYRLKHLVTLDVGGTTTDFGVVVDGRAVKHQLDRKSTRLNSSHRLTSRMPSSA
jgi:N-methylhydantoinase A/oxoprolinase/acetone carboxylase beta subunit